MPTAKDIQIDKILGRSQYNRQTAVNSQPLIDVPRLTTAITNEVMAIIISNNGNPKITTRDVERMISDTVRSVLLEATGIKSKAFDSNAVRNDTCRWCFGRAISFRAKGKAYFPAARKDYERADMHCLNCEREYQIEREIK